MFGRGRRGQPGDPANQRHASGIDVFGGEQVGNDSPDQRERVGGRGDSCRSGEQNTGGCFRWLQPQPRLRDHRERPLAAG